MKVTLVNARNSDSTVTPYGLLTIAAVLEKSGHQMQVFDPFFGNLSFMEEIIKFQPDIIGISALTASYTQAKEIIQTFRKKLPQTKICMGGIHATALPERTLRELFVDFVVLGEGELTFLDICNHADDINSLTDFCGIAFLNHGNFIQKPRKPLIENLDDLPYPAWHLLPIEKYFIPPGYIRSYFLKRTLVIYSSRGCPFNCIFCASHEIFGHRLRRHSVDYFLGHIEFITKKYKLEGIYIMDDTFTLDNQWLESFCREKIKRGIDILWGCQGRVNTINEDRLSMLKEAGCLQMDFGVESGSQRVLDAIKKETNVGDIERAFSLCHKVGIRPYASVMVGNPQEEESDVILTQRLLKKIRPVYVSVCFSQPIPGSELFVMAKRSGWFNEEKETFDSRWDVRQSTDPIMTINFDKKQLKKFRARLQNAAFINNYFSFINFKNLPFILSLLKIIFVNPINFLKSIAKSFYTYKMDDIVDFVLTFYRLERMTEIIKSPAEL